MSIFTFEKEHSTVAPAKLYKALAKDSDNIIPMVVGAIQSVEIVEGNGGPGTIKKITAVEGGKSSYVLHKVEAIDEANLVYNYSIVGETGVEDILEKVSFETKVLPGPHGGSVVKITIKYHTKDNAALSEEVRGATKAKGTALSNAVEGARSSSVPHAAPHRGGYSSPLLQLYGGYPQPQLDYGYLPQPGYGYLPQPGYGYHPQPQPGSGYHPQPQPGSGYFPQPESGYHPQPQPGSGYFLPPGYGYFPPPGSGYFPPPPPGYGYFPPPGYGYFPPPGYGYAPPVPNPGTNNLFAKFGAALTTGVLSEFIGNMISEATSDTGA